MLLSFGGERACRELTSPSRELLAGPRPILPAPPYVGSPVPMASPLRWVTLALLLNLAASLRVPKPVVRTGNDAIWLLYCLKLRSSGCRLGTDLELKQSGSKGQGLFATRSIEAGSLIGRYNGELLTEEEYDARLLEMEDGQGMYVMEMNNGYMLVRHEPQTSRPLTELLLTRARLALRRTARTQRSQRSCATSTILCARPTARLSRWWTPIPRARLPRWRLWRKGTSPWARSCCSIVRAASNSTPLTMS